MRAPLPDRARWCWLGRVPFAATAQLQERVRALVALGAVPNTLLLCEHEPVITLGRSALTHNILASSQTLSEQGVSVERASRGGDVTYHGPGQLVGYPVFHLRTGVLAHVTWMANAIIEVLRRYDIEAEFRREQPGVWVGASKICAFGVHVRRRVAIHGFALNVAPNLSHFGLIVPCGLHGQLVTSMALLRPTLTPKIEQLAAQVVLALAEGRAPFEEVPVSSIAAPAAYALHSQR